MMWQVPNTYVYWHSGRYLCEVTLWQLLWKVTVLCRKKLAGWRPANIVSQLTVQRHYNKLEIVSFWSNQVMPKLAYELKFVLWSSGHKIIRKYIPFPHTKHFLFCTGFLPNLGKGDPTELGCVHFTPPVPPTFRASLRFWRDNYQLISRTVTLFNDVHWCSHNHSNDCYWDTTTILVEFQYKYQQGACLLWNRCV